MNIKKTYVWRILHNGKQRLVHIKLGVLYYVQLLGVKFRSKGINLKFRKIKALKDIHKGERCFIICSGPSLTLEDIELLKNETTFVMNSFVKALDDIDYVPTYYAIQDGRVYGRIREDFIKHKNEFKAVFAGRYFFKRHYYKEANWIRFPQYFMGGIDNLFLGEKTPDVKFSSDVSAAVFDGGTIAYSILQIACYMGFKEIYLLGADCEYKAGSINDFTDKKQHMNKTDLERDTGGVVKNWEKAYFKAYQYGKKTGISIINVTRGGKLEVFPRKQLEDII